MTVGRGAGRSPGQVVVFSLGEERFALPTTSVLEVLHLPKLHRPGGAPRLLAGFFRLADDLVPVVRLDHLLALSESPPGPYASVLLLDRADGPLGLLVERCLAVEEREVLPVEEERSANGCLAGEIADGAVLTHLLSPSRLLLAEEERRITELRQDAERRLAALDPGPSSP